MNDLTKQLIRIGLDIVDVMENNPKNTVWTQHELYLESKLKKHISETGWSYALDRLERAHIVRFVDPYYWILTPKEEILYLNAVEEFTDTKISPL